MKTTYLYTLLLLVAFFVASCVGLGQEDAATAESSGEKKQAEKLPEEEKGVVDSIPPLRDMPAIKLESPTHTTDYIVTFVRPDVRPDRRRLDLRKINPYRALPYPIDYMTEDSVSYLYDLSGLTLEEQERIMEGMRINPDAFRQENYLKIGVRTPVVEAKGNTVAIAYQIDYLSSEEDVLGTQGVVLLYNEKGEPMGRISDQKDGFFGIRLSTDGKYLAQKYGMAYGEEGDGQLDAGFKFYDLESGEMIFEWELEKDQFLEVYNFYPNTMYHFTYRIAEGYNDEIYLIDVLNKDVYRKVMDRQKLANNYPGYRNSMFLNYRNSKKIKDLIKDGFEKIN